MLFQVRLRPEGDSRAVGVMLFEIVGGYFTARVHAAGLEPLQRIPQHIHLNPTCNPGGGTRSTAARSNASIDRRG
jgi:hypothetical protein